MALAKSTDRGELRSAIEGLLRTCADLDRHAETVGQESREQTHPVARVLVGLRLPDLKGLADEVAGIGKQMNTDVTQTLADARQPYVSEIHELLQILAPLHGLAALPPLSSTPSTAGLATQFPAGFARAYVKDLLTGVTDSVTIESAEAARSAVPSEDEIRGAKESAHGGFSQMHADEGVKMIKDSGCHAVERHGPQIPNEAQLARLIWLKDPSGEMAWQVEPSGAVQSRHWAGVATGGFTSPEALARPIDAFLSIAHSRAGGIDEFLSNNTDDEDNAISIHVGAEIAGLRAGDTFGYRGTGTGMKETRRDWIKAREYGMVQGRSTVHGTPHDIIADGADPGVTMIFKRLDTRWRLVTCYPVESPAPAHLRLEDLQ